MKILAAVFAIYFLTSCQSAFVKSDKRAPASEHLENPWEAVVNADYQVLSNYAGVWKIKSCTSTLNTKSSGLGGKTVTLNLSNAKYEIYKNKKTELMGYFPTLYVNATDVDTEGVLFQYIGAPEQKSENGRFRGFVKQVSQLRGNVVSAKTENCRKNGPGGICKTPMIIHTTELVLVGEDQLELSGSYVWPPSPEDSKVDIDSDRHDGKSYNCKLER